MKDSRRSQRVADLVRAELSLLVLTEAHDPDLHRVTITDVEMPSDLKSARVFFSCLGGEEEREKAADALRRAAGYLRREIGQRCRLRYAPELHFVSDRTLERGARIEELLHQVLSPREEGEDS
jgi:ribosome-binding factor A